MFSVVIPVGPQELEWVNLLSDLEALPNDSEVIFSATQSFEDLQESVQDRLQKFMQQNAARWVLCPPGRPEQLNGGAREATKDFLWFVHADSRLAPNCFSVLRSKVTANPDSLWYCDLKFSTDGPKLMFLNQWGVWIRSHLLGIPFGDQGLCVARNLFWELGACREDLPYGEDHILVWKARQSGVCVRGLHIPIRTSARKYRDRGWLRTTCLHLYLTTRQALPELLRYCRIRAQMGL